MKIEYELQANCSEGILTIIDWKNKKIISLYKTSSDYIEEDTFKDTFMTIVNSLKKGYHVEFQNDGDEYTDQIVTAARYVYKKGLSVKNFEAFFKEARVQVNN